jgi:hypothetical protein
MTKTIPMTSELMDLLSAANHANIYLRELWEAGYGERHYYDQLSLALSNYYQSLGETTRQSER